MPIDARIHMVSFRLTRAERDRYREICSLQGLPSISEMARAAIERMFAESGSVTPETLISRIAKLEKRIDFLTAEIRKLTQESALQRIPHQRVSDAETVACHPNE